MRDRTLSLQTEFQITRLIYIRWNPHKFTTGGLKLKLERNYTRTNYPTLLPTLSLTTPVRPVRRTGQTGVHAPAQGIPVRPVHQTGQTGPDKTDRLNTPPSSVQPDKPLT